MTEKEMFRVLKREKDARIISIETTLSDGIPDVFVMSYGRAIWAELKQGKSTRKGLFTPKWEPGQMAWAKEHKNHGGHWIMLACIDETLLYSTEPMDYYNVGDMQVFKNFREIEL